MDEQLTAVPEAARRGPAGGVGGTVTLLAALGYVGARVREDVSARMPSEEERDLLGTSPDEPVLRLTRLTLDRDGRPIQVDAMTMPASRRRLRYEIALD